MAIRIVHTADLQLDRPFAGLGQPPDWLVPELAEAACSSWDRTVELALDVGADAFVAVGGLPGAEQPCADAVAWRFVAGLERLAAARIPTLLVPGPHDAPAALPPGWSPPGHVQLLPPGAELGATLRLDNGADLRFLIGARACADSTATTAAPLLAVVAERALPLLDGANLDATAEGVPCYWALGGRGEALNVRNGPNRPWLVQPGPSQPRRFGGPGQRSGAVVVDLEGDRTPRWAAVDHVRLATAPVTLADAGTLDGLADKLRASVADLARNSPGRSLVLRGLLVGTGPLRSALADANTLDRLLADLRDDAAERVWWADLYLAALPPADLDAALAASPLGATLNAQHIHLPDVPAATWAEVLSTAVDLLSDT